MLGLRLVFTQGRTDPVGTACLRQATTANHKVEAYMLGVLLYGDNEAEQYIRKVEDEDITHGCKPEASRTNRECVRCHEQAVDAVREVLWRVDGTMDPVNVHIPGWNADVFKWKFRREGNITEDKDG